MTKNSEAVQSENKSENKNERVFTVQEYENCIKSWQAEVAQQKTRGYLKGLLNALNIAYDVNRGQAPYITEQIKPKLIIDAINAEIERAQLAVKIADKVGVSQ